MMLKFIVIHHSHWLGTHHTQDLYGGSSHLVLKTSSVKPKFLAPMLQH